MFNFFRPKKNNSAPAVQQPSTSDGSSIVGTDTKQQLQNINQELYKRNVELAIRNKTLSLLKELYGISIQTLEAKALTAKIADVIQKGFSFELVGIFLLSVDGKILQQTALAQSERVVQYPDDDVLLKFSQRKFIIAKYPLLQQLINQQKPAELNRLADIWGGTINTAELDAFQKEVKIATTLLYPLSIADRTLGLLAVCINQPLQDLPVYEREAIESFVNVISVALDKAMLYQQLNVANKQLAEKNAQLKKLDEAKSEFISIASHQLRTPLTVIKGYISMMLEGSFGQLNTQEVESLHKVYESNQRLIDLVEDLLNISRIESGRLQFNWANENMEDLASSVVDELQQNAKKKKLQLEYVAPAERLPQVKMDNEKLRQVFMNLVDNSIKYTEQGSVHVSVKLEGDSVVSRVSDSGMGIDPEDLPNLFQKFSRGKGMSLVHTEGTGLGLYVAREMVAAHGGRVWAESPGKGRGSTFIVSLPIIKEKKTAAAATTAKKTPAKKVASSTVKTS